MRSDKRQDVEHARTGQGALQRAPDALHEIIAPRAWSVPVVFSSPHSGRFFPDGFLSQSCLSELDLRRSEDAHVDDLFKSCAEHGAPLLRALVSRAVVDLNREPTEFDQKLFAEPLPGHLHSLSPRATSGLGVIPRVVGEGRPIYRAPLSLAEAQFRVEHYYRPYHRTLAQLLDEAHAATGFAFLVDCHSMPSSSVAATSHGAMPDVVLGDRFGASCDATLVSGVEQLLRQAGLKVAHNRPYAGGFITEMHGRPRAGRHALQIEINRAVYLDEATLLPNSDYYNLKLSLERVILQLLQLVALHVGGLAQSVTIAAE
jgi:N-formylglutamate amidohydrolase